MVRSTKEKRYEEITNLIKLIRNYKKIKDMSSMLSSEYYSLVTLRRGKRKLTAIYLSQVLRI